MYSTLFLPFDGESVVMLQLADHFARLLAERDDLAEAVGVERLCIFPCAVSVFVRPFQRQGIKLRRLALDRERTRPDAGRTVADPQRPDRTPLRILRTMLFLRLLPGDVLFLRSSFRHKSMKGTARKGRAPVITRAAHAALTDADNSGGSIDQSCASRRKKRRSRERIRRSGSGLRGRQAQPLRSSVTHSLRRFSIHCFACPRSVIAASRLSSCSEAISTQSSTSSTCRSRSMR